MKKELAEYILCLSELLNNTKQANDRELYISYIADAGILMASIKTGINTEKLRQKVSTHERLICNTWVTNDSEYETFYGLWTKFKNLVQ